MKKKQSNDPRKEEAEEKSGINCLVISRLKGFILLHHYL